MNEPDKGDLGLEFLPVGHTYPTGNIYENLLHTFLRRQRLYFSQYCESAQVISWSPLLKFKQEYLKTRVTHMIAERDELLKMEANRNHRLICNESAVKEALESNSILTREHPQIHCKKEA
jgi:hypothetical protein